MIWEQLWLIPCAYFGLKSVGPEDDGASSEGTPAGQISLTRIAWVASKKSEWDRWVKANGAPGSHARNDELGVDADESIAYDF